VLSKPALTIGAAALSLVIELVTIFILVLLLLLEAPKMRRAILGQMKPHRAEEATRVAGDVNGGDRLHAGEPADLAHRGLVVFVSLLVLGVPYPLLWACGGPGGLPAHDRRGPGRHTDRAVRVHHSVTAGIATAVVFLVYTQVENHILNPVIMSKTVRISRCLC